MRGTEKMQNWTEVYRLVKFKNVNDAILYKNISSAVIYKGIAIVVSMLSTPLYIDFINDHEVLGIWFTILSLLQWMSIFDVGIGNGLRNNIVSCLQMGDKRELKRYISSGYIVLGGIVALLIFILFFVVALCDWNAVLNISAHKIDVKDLRLVVALTMVTTLVGLELKIAMSILYALQKNALVNLTTLVTNTVILLFLFFASKFSVSALQGIKLLAVVYSIASIFPLIVLTIFLFKCELKGVAPSFSSFDAEKAKTVVNSSADFFIVQIGLIVIVSTNAWLITWIFGASYAVDYQIYNKLYSLAPMAFTLITQSVWSGFSAAKARKDLVWIQKKYYQVIYFAGACIIGIIMLTAVLPIVMDIWLKDRNIGVSISTSLIFLFSTAMQLAMYCFTCFANGINRIKCQVFCITLGAIIKIPLVFLLTTWFNSWTMIVLSEGLALIPLVICQPIINHMDLIKLKK